MPLTQDDRLGACTLANGASGALDLRAGVAMWTVGAPAYGGGSRRNDDVGRR